MADQNYKKLSELSEMLSADIDNEDLLLVSDSSAAASNTMASKKLKFGTLSTVASVVASKSKPMQEQLSKTLKSAKDYTDKEMDNLGDVAYLDVITQSNLSGEFIFDCGNSKF